MTVNLEDAKDLEDKSNKIKDTWINITNFFIDIANVIGDILVN